MQSGYLDNAISCIYTYIIMYINRARIAQALSFDQAAWHAWKYICLAVREKLLYFLDIGAYFSDI